LTQNNTALHFHVKSPNIDARFTIEDSMKNISHWDDLFEPVDTPLNLSLTKHFRYLKKELSSSMNKALRNILLGNPVSVTSRTLNALKKRELVDEEFNLSESARVLTVLSLPLTKQCEFLNIELVQKNIPSGKTHEESVLKYFDNLGYNGFHSEGDVVFTILQAMLMHSMMPFLKHLQMKKVDIEYRFLSRLLNRPINKQIETQILDRFKNISRKELHECINILQNARQKTVFETSTVTINLGENSDYKIYEIDSLLDAYSAIGKDILIMIFRKINSSEIKMVGWPDVMVYNDDSFKLIEVKKRDKLTPTQIITLPTLLESNLPVGVYKV